MRGSEIYRAQPQTAEKLNHEEHEAHKEIIKALILIFVPLRVLRGEKKHNKKKLQL